MTFFDSFSKSAMASIMLAQEEMRRLGHNHLGSDAILLGLLAEKTGLGAAALNLMGLKLKNVRAEVERIEGHGAGSDELIPFTPTAKRLFELAAIESASMGQSVIDTEHLLLAMENECLARRVLENLGVDISNIRAIVIESIKEQSKES